jgi:hypothetical protein
MKNLNHFHWLAEPCYLCLSKTAILKIWKYSRSTDSPDFFTPSLPAGERNGVREGRERNDNTTIQTLRNGLGDAERK